MAQSIQMLLGESIFTSMRSVNGEVPLLEEHLRRLYENCNDYYFNNRLNREDFLNYYLPPNFIEQTLRKYPNHYLRISFYSTSSSLTPNLGICDVDFEVRAQEKNLLYKSPVKCSLVNSPFTQDFKPIKAGSYFQNLYARKKARVENFEDIIFMRDNCLTEAATSNLILKAGDTFYTPDSKEILPGVCLKLFANFCEQSNYKFEYKKIKTRELSQFEFGFLSNSVQFLTPISQIENIYYNVDEALKLINEFHRYIGINNEKN